jgi:hypothetical protein
MTVHRYRVRVTGYVFPALPVGASEDEVKKLAQEEAEAGELDVTNTEIESEFFDD